MPLVRKIEDLGVRMHLNKGTKQSWETGAFAMHYEETNRLTDAVFDPYSKQPSYKACAVRVVRRTVGT